MPSQVSSSDEGRDATRARARWSWLVPAGTFVAGCVLGGAGAGLLGATGDEPRAAPASARVEPGGGADGAAADRTSEPGRSGLYVRVPDSCVRTADDATTLVERVDRVVAAVGDLEPERLRQRVDDVQQIRDAVEDVAQQCRTAAAQRLQEAAAAEGAAAASPAS